jgi:hypothetical protein
LNFKDLQAATWQCYVLETKGYSGIVYVQSMNQTGGGEILGDFGLFWQIPYGKSHVKKRLTKGPPFGFSSNPQNVNFLFCYNSSIKNRLFAWRNTQVSLDITNWTRETKYASLSKKWNSKISACFIFFTLKIPHSRRVHRFLVFRTYSFVVSIYVACNGNTHWE